MLKNHAQLLDLFNLEKIDSNLFIGKSFDLVGRRVFGGQLIGQAIVAASRTTNKQAHSLHAYFINPGTVDHEIFYEVINIQESRLFSKKIVNALQKGKKLFTCFISFTQNELQENNVLNNHNKIEYKKKINELVLSEKLITDFNILSKPVKSNNKLDNNILSEHFKTYEYLEDEFDKQYFHQAIAAYYSDYNLLSASLDVHSLDYLSKNIMTASLDHTIYFHQNFRADNWIFYKMSSSITSGSRGLNHGEMWQNGNLICSVTQENLMRSIS